MHFDTLLPSGTFHFLGALSALNSESRISETQVFLGRDIDRSHRRYNAAKGYIAN